jgi:hypothetical protein
MLYYIIYYLIIGCCEKEVNNKIYTDSDEARLTC